MARIQEWPEYRSGQNTGVARIQEWPEYRSGQNTGVARIQEWPEYRSGQNTGVARIQEWPDFLIRGSLLYRAQFKPPSRTACRSCKCAETLPWYHTTMVSHGILLDHMKYYVWSM